MTVAWLLSALSLTRLPADELAGEFTVKEAFGVSHPDQIIDFDFNGEVDPANAYLIGPDGNEVVYQRLSDGKIAVRTDLPPNSTKTWRLMTGRSPTNLNGGIQVADTEDYLEITNEFTGVRIPTPNQHRRVPPAPVQAVRYRDGTWSESGFNELTFPRFLHNDHYLNEFDPSTGGLKPRPTVCTDVSVRFVERGPLRTVLEVSYELWRDAARNPGGGDFAPAGPAFYRCTIQLEAGQPSILFEEDADTEVYWGLDVSEGIRPDQARYRGYGSSSAELGREPEGGQYRPASSRPAMDALVDLRFIQPVTLDYFGVSPRPLMVWDPGGRLDIGHYWQVYHSEGQNSNNIAGVFAGPASRAIGAGVSGVGVFTLPGALIDHVSRLDSAGALHSVYQTGDALWHVQFDSALIAAPPNRIALGLTNPDFVVRRDGSIGVVAFDRREGHFVLAEPTATGSFSLRPLSVLGDETLQIEDPYPYLATTADREFLFFFGKVNGESGGILLSREAGSDPFVYQGIVTDGFKLLSQSKRPTFTALASGQVLLLYQAADQLVAKATILAGASTFGAPGDGRIDPLTGVGGFYNLGTSVDPVTGQIFVAAPGGELWHSESAGKWTMTNLPLGDDYGSPGPNRRTLATEPNGDALAVHNKLNHFQPESQVWLRTGGQWQAFPHAPGLRMASARVHYHAASQQFVIIGRVDGMLKLFGWRSNDTEPRLLSQLPETEKRGAGFAVSVQRGSADGSFYSRVRFSWGLFVGTKGADLKDPYDIQPIARQMNLHGGINLNKVHRWGLEYPDPDRGYGGLFMDESIVRAMIARLRSAEAPEYYHYLMGKAGDEATQNLINMWADTTGVRHRSVANDICGTARNILDALVNRDGVYESRYRYWIGGAEMSRRGVFIDSVLADLMTTTEDRLKVKAAAAAFANVLWDDDFAPMFGGHGLSLGTANMASQQTGYRNFYALLLAEHPAMSDRATAVTQAALADLDSRVNYSGSHISSPHYVETWTPTLNSLLQIQQTEIRDPFREAGKLAKFAEFYLNLSTPPEPRFGALRKLISVGDGSTESMPMFGELATGFRRADPALSARLMGMWEAQGKPHAHFFGTTLLKIDESAPQQDPALGSAYFPGYYSVVRYGWGTPNETALWLIQGDHYSDHRHDDHGSVVIYALGAPLSIDWGSTYSPQTPGPFAHNLIVPESVYPQPWDRDDVPLHGYPNYYSGWTRSAPERFLAFPNSARSSARIISGAELAWSRAACSIFVDDNYPILVITDSISGPGSDAPQILTQNFMATGEAETPAGRISPPVRSWRNYGPTPQSELPSIGPLIELPAGISRLRFTGQWLIDWDVYLVSDQARQAHLGNWGHDWHPSREAGDFQGTNGRPFEERQHILRVRGTGGFKTLILPYRKGARPEGLNVSQDGANLVVKSAQSETILGADWFASQSSGTTVLASFDEQPVTAFGWEVSGGPVEVAVCGGKMIVTASGAPGLRRVKLPGDWIAQAPLVKVGDEFQLNATSSETTTGLASHPNRPPVLRPLTGQAIAEGVPLSLAITADDPDGDQQTLRYSVVGAPEGSTLDSLAGVFKWTPSEAQGPGEYPMTVRVTDNGVSPLFAETTFIVTVAEINQPPILAAVTSQSASAGIPFVLTLAADDSDLPENLLRWSLTEGAPSGMTIHPTSGVVTWTPSEIHSGQSYSVSVTVRDDGSPAGADQGGFLVAVAQIPSMPPTLTARRESDSIVISFPTQAGRVYRLQARTGTAAGEWRDEGDSHLADGGSVSFRVPVTDVSLYLRVEVRTNP